MDAFGLTEQSRQCCSQPVNHPRGHVHRDDDGYDRGDGEGTRGALVGQFHQGRRRRLQGLQGFRASIENTFDSRLHLIGRQEGASDGTDRQRGWGESEEGEERQAPRHDASAHGGIAEKDRATELDKRLQS